MQSFELILLLLVKISDSVWHILQNRVDIMASSQKGLLFLSRTQV